MYFFKSHKIATEEEEVLVSKNFVTFACDCIGCNDELCCTENYQQSCLESFKA